jgi:hypothetical protein
VVQKVLLDVIDAVRVSQCHFGEPHSVVRVSPFGSLPVKNINNINPAPFRLLSIDFPVIEVDEVQRRSYSLMFCASHR